MRLIESNLDKVEKQKRMEGLSLIDFDHDWQAKLEDKLLKETPSQREIFLLLIPRVEQERQHLLNLWKQDTLN